MSKVPNSSDPAVNRAYAARIIDRITHHQTFVNEQVASLSKWLTASLLAVNGGGAIASMNAVTHNNAFWLPGLLFAFGVIFALLSAVVLQEIYNRVGEPLLDLDNYWTSVGISGERDEEEEAGLERALRGKSRFAFIAPTTGWVSGILFLSGALLLAFQ